jgi:hypothetical protein
MRFDLLSVFVRLGCVVCLTGISAARGQAETAAKILPDYAGIVLPPNIAPLNFKILESGQRYRVAIRGEAGTPIQIDTGNASIRIPSGPWHSLLAANAGKRLYVDMEVRGASGWKRFQTITNTVAAETIDGWLAYRVIRPLFNAYTEVGIFQRDLSSFEEKPALRGAAFDNGCVNCHTFLNHDPKTMAIHIRAGDSGNPMLLARNGSVVRVDRAFGYMSWHPSGRLIAYSSSQLSLRFHTFGETRDVYDAKSDLGVYRVDQNAIEIPPALARPERQEIWPTWSPDGKYLYFCSAEALPVERVKEVRYDLMRVSFNIDTGAWGEPETLVAASQMGLSAAEPRVSPDNRFVLFCMAKWGHFPVYQTNSDLYLYEVATRESRHLDINSAEADTWHCWSADGRWIVFSSKRRDGLFARPHFSWFDGAGHFSKPFILPQQDPSFYDSYTRTINVPELMDGPIAYTEAELAGAVNHPKQSLTPSADANAAGFSPSVGESDRPAALRK